MNRFLKTPENNFSQKEEDPLLNHYSILASVNKGDKKELSFYWHKEKYYHLKEQLNLAEVEEALSHRTTFTIPIDRRCERE
ncbi:hypothetical protein CDAR_108981 [Caerostris darwini]|uniref:Uncharacterized protein n=1 Tax=Caerostris darwini TaxID=1538125 RepID=A0AAV4QQ78_9ARAC|nr:hypothetical protein CDAR_108981 [Caerostris darwini]